MNILTKTKTNLRKALTSKRGASLKLLYIILPILLIGFLVYSNKDTLSVKFSSHFAKTATNTDFELSIDKLDISVPVLTGIDPANKDEYNKGLTKGVAHFKGTALPGSKGNVFIYGHSSSDIKSPYDKIFARLNGLTVKDKIVVKYKGSSYTYTVREKKIVEKDDLSVLDQPEEKILTLMTCWPIGTSDQRIIVIAKQD